ncbi:site-2 protease family protein [Fervidobacterium thailandense]|uniref:Peptidase n=1 Tax=Fervidobacterium thailandense TaxID=1008305 RepID=A0A1E3G4D8_9BACT|nr:site-2 protease family protein [Fervidobacterium thailandense]ODN31135.1 peptidase [Fervidobacterium thailandense]
MTAIVNVVAFILVFMFIVVVHELGHFLFARIFGVTVKEFAIGFGPHIYRRRGKRTDFRINIFPLGGYVRLKGEEPGEAEEPDALYGVAAWKRFLIVLAGPLFSIAAGYLLFMLIIGTWGFRPIVIDDVVPNSPAQRVGISAGDVVLKINGRYVFDNVDMTAVIRKGQPVELELLREGRKVTVNVTPEMTKEQYYLHFEDVQGEIGGEVLTVNNVDFETYVKSWKREYVSVSSERGELKAVLSNASITPKRYAIGIYYGQFSNIIAKDVGPFKKSDVITSIGGLKVENSVDLIDAMTALSLGNGELYVSLTGRKVDKVISPLPEQVVVTVHSRSTDGSTSEHTLTLAKEELKKILSTPGIFELAAPVFKPSGLEFLKLSIERTNRLALYIWRTLPGIFFGRNVREVTGPVGMVQIIGQAVQVGLETILTIVAIITINLGIFNLLPLPALDGGRIVFALLEMVARRKINRDVENLIHTVGFFLLLGLLVFITFVDVARMMGR